MSVKTGTGTAILFLVVISVIVLVPLSRTNLHGTVSGENRMLAVRPDFPGFNAGAEKLRSFNRDAENWLNDRIGLRDRFVRYYGTFHANVLHTSPHQQLMLGRDGYAFLASHGAGNTAYNSLVKQTLGLPSVNENDISLLVNQVIEAKKIADDYGVPTAYVIIPQHPLLDYNKLPFYIRNFVNEVTVNRPPEVRVKENLPPDIKEWIVYPYEEAKLYNTISSVYPKNNFHWVPGQLTAITAAKIAEYFGVYPYTSPNPEEYQFVNIPSDISHIAGFPMNDPAFMGLKEGILSDLEINSNMSINNKYAELEDLIGFTYCFNKKLKDTKKILWLGDSFSPAPSGDLARYFTEVLCIDLAYLGSKGLDAKTLVNKLLKVYQPNYIVFETHIINPGFISSITPDSILK